MRVRQPPPDLAALGDPAQVAVARVLLENVRRAVLRLVIGRDDEVDAGVQVVLDLRVDDVQPRRERRASARASSRAGPPSRVSTHYARRARPPSAAAEQPRPRRTRPPRPRAAPAPRDPGVGSSGARSRKSLRQELRQGVAQPRVPHERPRRESSPDLGVVERDPRPDRLGAALLRDPPAHEPGRHAGSRASLSRSSRTSVRTAHANGAGSGGPRAGTSP